MPKYAGVWGIDIGQAAFKALRCRAENGQVEADAFDFIEYPKILSQPEADAETSVRTAIEQFLSRNDLKGYKVALAVSGQSGLAKFFKPPPVEAKRIPDIVKYEAKQQIPFALEDVVWDFQQMGGGEIEDFAVETEVGLFAMKRDQVYRAMQPFRDAGIELDIIQLAPLSIYNFVTYDVLGESLEDVVYDPDNPNASLVVLSMGTETTDLVITNGFRVWQRSIPLGGNHFTKQLTRELKLTFAKAEHLKRNVRQAEDPKMVFQAMKPVFNDLVTEVQRSIGYFQGIDRKAKIEQAVVLGNAVKLPGMPQYLARHLGFEVKDFHAFARLKGDAVLSAPAFRDNLLSFGACYGLCLQGLDVAPLKTNLVPREVMTDRLVRAKKPWAVAAVGALLLGCTFNIFFHYRPLKKAADDYTAAGVTWKQACDEITAAGNLSTAAKSEDDSLVGDLGRITAIGEELVGNADRNLLWLEMLKTLNTALPQTPGITPGEIPDVDEIPFDKRQEIHIQQVEVQYFDDLKAWFAEPVKAKFIEQRMLDADPAGTGVAAAASGAAASGAAASGAAASGAAASGAASASAQVAGPSGKGWVMQLNCYHYFNSDRQREGLRHVLDTLIDRLKRDSVAFPVAVNRIRAGNVIAHQEAPDRLRAHRVVAITPPAAGARTPEEAVYQIQLDGVQNPLSVPANTRVPVVFSMEEMGISYPVVLQENPINREFRLPNPNYEPPEMGYPGGGMGSPAPGPSSGGAGIDGSGGALDGSGSFGGTGGGRVGGFGRDAGAKPNEPSVPQYLVVPRYDFIVQFCWTEFPLTERLEKQVADWTAQQQGQGGAGPQGNQADLAANVKGGA
ncbi:MAG: pilus assembly protein PilM [Planctomycetes bacterium]|nr:pilus assembly protein PilM [Planctomycetota bacterium]